MLEAEQLFRRAVDAGDTVAMNNLGVLLYQRGDLAKAKRLLRQAANAGHTEARNNLEVLLKRQGERGGRRG